MELKMEYLVSLKIKMLTWVPSKFLFKTEKKQQLRSLSQRETVCVRVLHGTFKGSAFSKINYFNSYKKGFQEEPF